MIVLILALKMNIRNIFAGVEDYSNQTGWQ